MLKYFINFIFIILLSNSISAQQQVLKLDNWDFKSQNASQWMKAYVPSNVHNDLYQNHQIENPFYGENESKLQWVDKEIWIYRTEFEIGKNQLDSRKIQLVFKGLDTYSKIYINGKQIAITDNMFREYKFSIKPLLHPGKNEIRVEFLPALEEAEKHYNALPYHLPSDARAMIRKSPYMFGWDWGVNYPSCGIWKPVYIQFVAGSTFTDVALQQLYLDSEKAEMKLALDFDTIIADIYLYINIKDKSGVCILDTICFVETIHQDFNFQISKPNLWWPHNYGEPYLYNINLELKHKGNLLNSKNWKFGLRNIRLVQKRDSNGRSFYFEVNGKAIFAKGANIIPFNHFPSKVSKDKYRYYLKKAKEANMNMLRVWGGGIYESDEFYDLCDEMGILVWQDFIFAGNMVPGDSLFVDNVKEEVSQQVNRLRKHPSLALWCGNNEVSEAWYNWGWKKQFNLTKDDSAKIFNDYKNLFEREIPNLVDILDSGRYYHPSSPTTGWGRKESLLLGDMHYWGVWWGMKPLESYQTHVGRFVSEYGFQGMPSINTLAKYIPDSQLYPGSSALKAHQKHPRGFETIDEYRKRNFGKFDSLDDYIYASQLLQARAMKIGIEAHRQEMPNCQGSLVWQFNDTWPVISWSLIDYEEVPKAAYYQVKHSFNTTLITAKACDSSILVIGTSDSLKSVSGILEVILLDFDGKIHFEKKQNAVLAAGVSKNILEIPFSELPINHKYLKSYFLRITFKSDNGKEIQNTYYFGKPKEMPLKYSNIEVKYLANNKIELECTEAVAWDIFLQAEGVEFEDNLFTLIPGEKVRVSYRIRGEGEGEKLVVKVYSLNDVR